VAWLWTPVLPTTLWTKAISSTTSRPAATDVAQHLAALAIRLNSQTAISSTARGRPETPRPARQSRRLAVMFDQLGLEVEQIDVAGRPGHEQLDDALGLWRMVENHGPKCV
jgi:hypothetical protein